MELWSIRQGFITDSASCNPISTLSGRLSGCHATLPLRMRYERILFFLQMGVLDESQEYLEGWREGAVVTRKIFFTLPEDIETRNCVVKEFSDWTTTIATIACTTRVVRSLQHNAQTCNLTRAGREKGNDLIINSAIFK